MRTTTALIVSRKLVIRQVFDNQPVAPFVMLGSTDCMHFVPVCNNIYPFTSFVMDESLRELEHGIGRRMPIPGMAIMGKFYARLMQVWGARKLTAGAMLTLLAESTMPEAFEHGGKLVSIITVMGFLAAAVLSVMEGLPLVQQKMNVNSTS